MKKINKHFCLMLLFAPLLFWMGCSEDRIDLAGLGRITGKVVQKESNEPLENVKISTNPPSSTVFTDQDGNYIIQNIPSGDYTLSAQREDLLAQFEAVSVIADEAVEIVFEMEDETAANRPPYQAILLAPADNEKDVDVNVTLVWSGSDPDPTDELSYQLTLRNGATDEVLEFENIQDTVYNIANLKLGTKYFWQVATIDGVNDAVQSEINAFTTIQTPDNRILYTRIVDGNNVIYSTTEEGQSSIQLTSTSKNSYRPRKNSFTNTIAFLQNVGSDIHVFVMDEDGSNQIQITNQVAVSGFNAGEIDFSWDNNGASILYPNQNKLYRINVDGSGLQLVYETENDNLITEVVTNDEVDFIVLKTNDLEGYTTQIFSIDTNGQVVRNFLEDGEGAAGGLDLSIDGNRLLYTYDVSEFQNEAYRRLDSNIFLFNLLTNERINLSQEKPVGTNDFDPRFSPNEAAIIYTNTSNDGRSSKQIETLSITNLNSRSVIIEDAFMPDWD